jgi:hypothetical protein
MPPRDDIEAVADPIRHEVHERYTQADPDAPAPAQGSTPGVAAEAPVEERTVMVDPGGNLIDRQGRLLPPAEIERLMRRLQERYGAGLPGDAGGMPGGAATKSVGPVGMTAAAIGELHRRTTTMAAITKPASGPVTLQPAQLPASVAHLAGKNLTGELAVASVNKALEEAEAAAGQPVPGVGPLAGEGQGTGPGIRVRKDGGLMGDLKAQSADRLQLQGRGLGQMSAGPAGDGTTRQSNSGGAPSQASLAWRSPH